MEKVKISFLMVAYNTEKYIEKAVSSILNQSMREINLFVRNNGSTDGTGKILRRIAATDSRLHVLENKKNWTNDDSFKFTEDDILKLWDIKDREALGEYISIVDSDDWLYSDFAEIMYKSAKNINADFVVCGCTFMIDGKFNAGDRLPPEISTDDKNVVSDIIRSNFIDVYNCLRTWWGKLYRTEFFYEHYNFAWKLIPTGVLDTVHALRYAFKAKSSVYIRQALYYFRSHQNSTYNTRPHFYCTSKEAEELYLAGYAFLDDFNAHTPVNDNLLFSLHRTYLLEALKTLNVSDNNNSDTRYDLSWISVLFNNSVIAKVLLFDVEMNETWEVIGDNLKNILKHNSNDLSVYTSFLMRLAYVELLIESKSKLAFPILMGCLYDTENKNSIGKQFLTRVAISDEFQDLAQDAVNTLIWQKQLNPKYLTMFNRKDFEYERIENLRELEKQLLLKMDNGEYESVCDLLEELLTLNPLSRVAMFCRIKVSMMLDEKELAVVLAGTAISLWPVDIEMQRLCWDVFSEVAADYPE